MTKKAKINIENLRDHLKQEFTHDHLDTLKKVAKGSYDGDRKGLIDAFKAAGANVRRANAGHSDFNITSAYGEKWRITMPMNIELHNGVNALSDAARTALKECQEVMSPNESEPSAH
ncbi:MAG: hypothetical protein ACRBB3_01945 [Alphaproteobacteria bacterium]